jgi:hypothetical protein
MSRTSAPACNSVNPWRTAAFAVGARLPLKKESGVQLTTAMMRGWSNVNERVPR